LLECRASDALERAAEDQSAEPGTEGWLPEGGYILLVERAHLMLQLPDHLLPRRQGEIIRDVKSLTWWPLVRP